MDKEKVHDIVINALKDYYEGNNIDGAVNDETALFGARSELDSMGLVTVIVDIETRLSEENVDITLTSRSALSQEHSPFKNVETIVDFVCSEIRNSS